MPSSSTNKTKSDFGKPPAQIGEWFITTKSARKPNASNACKASPPTSPKHWARTPQQPNAPRVWQKPTVTEMVGEFPELQGTMGKYYARLDGETEEIAEAIEQHYQPRFAATTCQRAKWQPPLLWLINWKPGRHLGHRSDPDRRQRPIRPAPLRIGYFAYADAVRFGRKRTDSDGLQQLPARFAQRKTPSETADFMQARLAVLLQNDYPQDIVAAVLAKQPRRLTT